MRNWIALFENAMAKGPISGHPIRNTGDIGHLEDVLCAWVEGETKRAEPYLLSMREMMAPYKTGLQGQTLYRGICLSGDEIRAALRDGITISHRNKAIESWSTEADEVDRFMAGWDRPWIMISCPSDRLDVLIELAEFDHAENPHTNMRDQLEVLVVAKAQEHFTADQIHIEFSLDELAQYERDQSDF